MRLALHQPHFLPWIPYFSRLAQVDVFVFLDDVQYRRTYFHNRCRILSTTGKNRWLTVPVNAALGAPIESVQPSISDTWLRKLRSSIVQAYGVSAEALRIVEAIEVASERHESIGSFNIRLLLVVLEILGIKKPVIYRSSLLPARGDCDHIPLFYSRLLGATEYIYGSGAGMQRHDPAELHRIGIRVLAERRLLQFTPGLSVVDEMCLRGFNSAKAAIEEGVEYVEAREEL